MKQKHLKKSKRKKYTLIISSIIVLVLFLWALWGNFAVQTTFIEIKDKAVPDSFEGYTIAHISDLHNARLGKINFQLIQALESNQPDIICITGDLVDSNHTDLNAAIEFAGKAVQIAPCYYVTGNHEAWLEGSTYQELENALIQCGVNVLHNEYTEIYKENDFIYLTGIDDFEFPHDGKALYDVTEYKAGSDNTHNEEELLSSVKKYNILLSHRPEAFKTYVYKQYNLVLSGHAHGGQFRIPFIGGIVAPGQGFFPQYDNGAYTENQTTMIVSRGIGNSIIPLRINNRPEIIFITLYK